MDFEALLKGCTLIELDAVDNREQKALFMSLLLLQIKLVIRQNQKKDSSLKNVILIDEAHVLLDNGSPAAEKKDADPEEKIEAYLLDMVKVNRVYGTGMIFADQSLAVLKSFVNNSDIKAVMHLEAYEEREFIMNNLNLSEDMYRAIAELGTGEFYISCQDLDRPVKLKLDDVREVYDIPHDISDEQVSDRMSRNYETPFEVCPCASCNINVRSEADYIARNVCSRYFSSVTVSQGLDGKTASAIEQMISEMASECKDRQCLVACSRIMTDRMLKRKAALDDTAE